GEPARFGGTLRQGPERLIPVEMSFSLQGGFVLASAQDISVRLAAERRNDDMRERVERSESALQASQKVAQIAVFDWVVQDNGVAWSGELRALFGIEGGGNPPEDWRDLIDPEDREKVERDIRRALQ